MKSSYHLAVWRQVARCFLVIDQLIYLPSQETSLEQLIETVRDILAPGETAEDMALKSYQLEKLQEVLGSLPNVDRELIQELFYEEKTEREVCADLGMAKTTLHWRKAAILERLKKFWKNYKKCGPKLYLVTVINEGYFLSLLRTLKNNSDKLFISVSRSQDPSCAVKAAERDRRGRDDCLRDVAGGHVMLFCHIPSIR